MLNDKKVQTCSTKLQSFLPGDFRPELGIVLGTGLSSLTECLEGKISVPYGSLPGYPVSTVASHTGCFHAGRLSGVSVLLQEGRCHLYEGYTPAEVVLGVRVMASLGIKTLIVTNSAGALNPLFETGGIMLITDQINFTGKSPLTGLGDEGGRTRFPDMSRVYDQNLINLAERAGLKLGLRLEKGVYLGLCGPQMETRAETRMFRMWGADAVGMSTVMEVIAARHLGVKILGISSLSNKNLPDCMAEAPLEEVIAVSSRSGDMLKRLLREVAAGLPAERVFDAENGINQCFQKSI